MSRLWTIACLLVWLTPGFAGALALDAPWGTGDGATLVQNDGTVRPTSGELPRDILLLQAERGSPVFAGGPLGTDRSKELAAVPLGRPATANGDGTGTDVGERLPELGALALAALALGVGMRLTFALA